MIGAVDSAASSRADSSPEGADRRLSPLPSLITSDDDESEAYIDQSQKKRRRINLYANDVVSAHRRNDTEVLESIQYRLSNTIRYASVGFVWPLGLVLTWARRGTNGAPTGSSVRHGTLSSCWLCWRRRSDDSQN